MRIFQLKPSQMVIVICSVLTILISGEFYLMRNIFSSTKIQAKDLNPDADLQYGPFDVMSPTLSTFNRELWLSGRIQVNVNQTFSGRFDSKDPESLSSKVKRSHKVVWNNPSHQL